MNLITYAGKPYPLGATYDGKGVNFAIFSENATKVELCLFDANDHTRERSRIRRPERSHQAWHVCIAEVTPGPRNGHRVHGPCEPETGHRFNPNKLLTDRYAK